MTSITLVGVASCIRVLEDQAHHATPARYAQALADAAGVTPVLLPPVGALPVEILTRLDGLLLSGSPSNVDPACYGAPDETPDEHDRLRDAATLPLIREAIRIGLPMLGICRGLQEMNVALGGSLHQRVHLLDGRMDHRGGEGALAHRYRPKHQVSLEGRLAEIVGADRVMVNSVHGQAIDRLATGLVAEAHADDGTIEAVRVKDHPGFGFGVQWHPEWEPQDSPVSMALFAAFGAACRRRPDRLLAA